MKFTGIRRTFSTQNEEQYTTIGAFWEDGPLLYEIEEFDAYRKNYYPVNEEEKELNKEDFEKAWKHHYENNPHHPEYWIKDGVPTDMEIEYIVEMACDWIAMSIKLNNRAIDWYTDNKDNIKLHDETRKFVEKALDIIYSYID